MPGCIKLRVGWVQQGEKKIHKWYFHQRFIKALSMGDWILVKVLRAAALSQYTVYRINDWNCYRLKGFKGKKDINVFGLRDLVPSIWDVHFGLVGRCTLHIPFITLLANLHLVNLSYLVLFTFY
jgi:hypothetical protein